MSTHVPQLAQRQLKDNPNTGRSKDNPNTKKRHKEVNLKENVMKPKTIQRDSQDATNTSKVQDYKEHQF